MSAAALGPWSLLVGSASGREREYLSLTTSRRLLAGRVSPEWPDSAGDAEGAGPTIASVALIAVLFVVAAAMLAPGLVVGPSLDASVFSDVASRMLHGVTPYVGAWDHKPPGIYLVTAGAQATLGWLGPWTAEWLLSLAVSVGIGISVAAGLARLGVTGWPRSLAAIGATILASHYLLALGGGLTEPPAALLVGSAFVLAVRSTGGARLAGVGLLVGLSALVSVQLLPGGLIVLALALSQTTPGKRLRGTGLLALGFAAPLAGVAAWLLAIGAMPAALDAIVTYAGAYRSSGNEYGATLAASVVAWTILTALFLVAPAMLGAVSPASRLPARRASLYAVLLWIAATLLAIVLQGRFYAHYAIALAVPLGVLAGLGLHRVGESLRRAARPSARAVIALPFVATLLISVVAGVVSGAMQVALVADGSSRMEAVSERLRDLPPGTMLVWGNEPRLYSLADRVPATRYSYLYPLTTPRYSTAAQIDAVVQALAAHPPAVVVDVGSTAPGQPGFLPLLIDRPIASEGRDLDLLEPLRAFVAAHYRLEAIVSGWPIYLLREPQP